MKQTLRCQRVRFFAAFPRIDLLIACWWSPEIDSSAENRERHSSTTAPPVFRYVAKIAGEETLRDVGHVVIRMGLFRDACLRHFSAISPRGFIAPYHFRKKGKQLLKKKTLDMSLSSDWTLISPRLLDVVFAAVDEKKSVPAHLFNGFNQNSLEPRFTTAIELWTARIVFFFVSDESEGKHIWLRSAMSAASPRLFRQKFATVAFTEIPSPTQSSALDAPPQFFYPNNRLPPFDRTEHKPRSTPPPRLSLL